MQTSIGFLGEKAPNLDACDRASKQKFYAQSKQKTSGVNVPIKALTPPAIQMEQIHQEASQRYFHTQDTKQQGILQMANIKGGVNAGSAKKNFPNLMKLIELKSPLDNTNAKQEVGLQHRKFPKEETSYVEYSGAPEADNVASCIDTGRAIIILRQTQANSPDNERRAPRQTGREEETERCSFLQIKDVSGAARDSTVNRHKNENSKADTMKRYKENQLIIKRENNNNKNSEVGKIPSDNVKGFLKDYEVEGGGEMLLKQEARVLLKETVSSARERFFTYPKQKDLDKGPFKTVVQGGDIRSSSFKDSLTTIGGKLREHSTILSCKGDERVRDARKDEYTKNCRCSIGELREADNIQKYLTPSSNCLKVSENNRYLKRDATNVVANSTYDVGNRRDCNGDTKVTPKMKKEDPLHQNLAETTSASHNGRPREPTEYIEDNEQFRKNDNHKNYIRYYCHNEQAACMDETCRCPHVSHKESQEKADTNESAAKYGESGAKRCNIDVSEKDVHIETTNTQQVLIYCPPDVAPRLRNDFPADKRCNLELVTKRNSNMEACEEHLGEKLAIHTRSNKLHDLIQSVDNVCRGLTRTSNASDSTRKRNSGILGKRRGTSD